MFALRPGSVLPGLGALDDEVALEVHLGLEHLDYQRAGLERPVTSTDLPVGAIEGNDR